MGRTWDPQQAEEAAGHPAGEGDPEPQPDGRRSRTASLVSGLLTELYSCTEEEEVAAGGDPASQGRPPRRDSLDSSTETSGSDAFLGGRGAGDSRVLQELRERPNLRLQMQYLQRKGERPRGDSCLSVPPAPLRHSQHLLQLPTCATSTPTPCPHTRRGWSLPSFDSGLYCHSFPRLFPNAQPLSLCRCGLERGRVCPPPQRRSGVQGSRGSVDSNFT